MCVFYVCVSEDWWRGKNKSKQEKAKYFVESLLQEVFQNYITYKNLYLPSLHREINQITKAKKLESKIAHYCGSRALAQLQSLIRGGR